MTDNKTDTPEYTFAETAKGANLTEKVLKDFAPDGPVNVYISVLITNGEETGALVCALKAGEIPTEERIQKAFHATVGQAPIGYRLLTRHEFVAYTIGFPISEAANPPPELGPNKFSDKLVTELDIAAPGRYGHC